MAWRLDGTYFENCNCDVTCPCSATDFAVKADNERCRVLMAFHVDRGQVDDVDVAGLTVAVFADAPAMMIEGNWRVGLFIDGAASDEQAQKLGGVFSGQLGGPMASLSPLIGEFLGIEHVPIEYSNAERDHRVKIGDATEISVTDVASPLDPTGPPPTLGGGHHPANSTLNVGQAGEARISAFGIEIDNSGKNGFSAPFSWAG